MNKVLGNPLPYDNLEQVRSRLNEISPALTQYSVLQRSGFNRESVNLAQVFF
jgi:hypothetical protein